jgi:hypothetical protein
MFSGKIMCIADQDGVTISLYTRSSQVFGSSTGRDTWYTEVFRGFHQSFQANYMTVSRIGHGRFLPNRFTIHQPYHSTPHSLNMTAPPPPR